MEGRLHCLRLPVAFATQTGADTHRQAVRARVTDKTRITGLELLPHSRRSTPLDLRPPRLTPKNLVKQAKK